MKYILYCRQTSYVELGVECDEPPTIENFDDLLEDAEFIDESDIDLELINVTKVRSRPSTRERKE